MFRLPAGPGPVADFVVMVAGVCEGGAGVVIHIRRQVGVGRRQPALFDPPAQGGSLLQGERVEGQVLRSQRRRPRQGVLPLGQGLAGQAVHQVEVHIVEAGAAAKFQGGGGFVGVVAAAQQGQQPVVHTLDADADPVDAGGAQLGALGGGKVVGVALGGYFGIGAHPATAGDGVEDAGDGAFGQVRRSAAAKKDGVDARPAENPRPRGQFPDHRREEIVELGFDALVGVEVAIGAFAQAERDVDIQGNPIPAGRGEGMPARRRGLRHSGTCG